VSDTPSPPPTPAVAEPVSRRLFVKGVTAVLSFLLITVPLGIGAAFFLDPLLRKRKGNTDFIRVASLSELPENGVPRQFSVRADLVDAWTTTPNQFIGSIFLRRLSEDEVVAFSATCPHLGCMVDYTVKGENPAEASNTADGESTDDPPGRFWCACHESAFALDGERLNTVPPRPLDTLETKIEGDDIYVLYQNFLPGSSEKQVTS